MLNARVIEIVCSYHHQSLSLFGLWPTGCDNGGCWSKQMITKFDMGDRANKYWFRSNILFKWPLKWIWSISDICWIQHREMFVRNIHFYTYKRNETIVLTWPISFVIEGRPNSKCTFFIWSKWSHKIFRIIIIENKICV